MKTVPHRRKLFNSLARNMPAGYVENLVFGLEAASRRAIGNAKEDSSVASWFRPYLLGHLNHTYLQTAFERIAQDAGVAVMLHRTATGYPYPVVATGPFVITASAVKTPGEMPDEADYRAGLAAHNAAMTDPSLFESIVPSEFYKKHKLYLIVTHTPGSAEHNIPDTIRVGLPSPDWSGWQYQFNVRDIMKAQKQRVERKRDVVLTDKVAPRVRRQIGNS